MSAVGGSVHRESVAAGLSHAALSHAALSKIISDPPKSMAYLPISTSPTDARRRDSSSAREPSSPTESERDSPDFATPVGRRAV